ncbi:MAG: LysM peptidoglycan-binding domain-containing protein, partial [Sedimentisphaerales bacterium]
PGQSPQGRTESQSDVIKPKEPVEKQQIPSGSSTPNERDGDNISTHSESKPTDTAYNSEALSEQSSQPGVFDYDNAEVFKTERFYIVGKNQTLSEISRIYYHSANQWQRIVDANPQIRDPNKIKPGMKLIIPWDDE